MMPTEQTLHKTETHHDTYYHNIKKNACERIRAMFEKDGIDLGEVIHKTKIEHPDDMEILVAYVLKHGDPMSIAHILRYQTDWQHACNELHEHHD